jgi:hypothetical protein
MVAYCDPASMQSVEAAVLRCLDVTERGALEARIAGTTLRSWDDVGCDVMAALTSTSASDAVMANTEDSEDGRK